MSRRRGRPSSSQQAGVRGSCAADWTPGFATSCGFLFVVSERLGGWELKKVGAERLIQLGATCSLCKELLGLGIGVGGREGRKLARGIQSFVVDEGFFSSYDLTAHCLGAAGRKLPTPDWLPSFWPLHGVVHVTKFQKSEPRDWLTPLSRGVSSSLTGILVQLIRP